MTIATGDGVSATGSARPDRHVRIYEVGPRDGLQNEATPIPTDAKVRFVELLVAAGLREIEATSFVSPKAIPQLADADELLPALPQATGMRYPVLVPNLRGLARAEAAGAEALAVFTATTDAFTEHNIGDDRERLARRLRPRPRPGRRARLVAAGVRLDGLRLPVHRRGPGRPSRRGGTVPAGARRRRDLLRRHDRGRRPRPGRPT